jgi:hypothetical protein
MPGDRFEHAIDVVQDLLVPETQYSVALALQIFRATLIGLPLALLAMLATVKFDDERCVKTEVNPRCKTQSGAAAGIWRRLADDSAAAAITGARPQSVLRAEPALYRGREWAARHQSQNLS